MISSMVVSVRRPKHAKDSRVTVGMRAYAEDDKGGSLVARTRAPRGGAKLVGVVLAEPASDQCEIQPYWPESSVVARKRPPRCEGWRRTGGVFTLGPVTWKQCTSRATLLMTVKQEGGTKEFPACATCLKEAKATKGIRVLLVRPIASPGQRGVKRADG